MSVYFARAGLDGPIKIGSGSDAHQRIRVLQTGHHERLHLLAEIEGDAGTERALHRRFAKYRRIGEWFNPAPELLSFIASLPQVVAELEEPRTAVEVMLEALGGSGVVAELLGIPVNRVSNWKRRGVPWHWRPRLAEIARKRDVAVPARFLAPEGVSG